jgi:Flp pilus assembly protein TadG
MAGRIRSLIRRLHRGQRGQAFFFVVAAMAVIGGMAAIAIDLGSYSADRRDLQNAADAIALAASQDLPDQSDAIAAANEWAAKNGIDLADMTVTVIPQNLPSEPNPRVQVELAHDHDFTFARLIGITSSEVSASTSAVRTSPGGSGGLMPWSVLESAKSLAFPGDEVVLKYDANNVENGNFGALRLDGNGASDYEAAIKYGSENAYCADSAIGCPHPSVVDTKPGNMTGPTRDGTDHRIDGTEDGCDTWGEVVHDNGDGTHGLKADCNPFGQGGNPDSLRVVIVPVIDSLCSGTCTVTILEFALFFLEGYGDGGCTGNDCEIKGRFLKSNTNYGALMGVFDPDTFAHFMRLVQ